MKKTLIVIASIAFAGPAFAGGMQEVVIPPEPVSAPAPRAPRNWSGPYIGFGVIGTRTTPTVPGATTYHYACNRGEAKDHNANKCVIGGDWQSPEIDALTFEESPWSRQPASPLAEPGEVVRYDAGYDGIWLANNDQFLFSSPDVLVQPTTPVKGASFASLGSTTAMIVKQMNETEASAFAGMRWATSKRLVLGAEVSGSKSLSSLQAQIGYDAGRLLPYLSVGMATNGDDSGLIYGGGVDWMASQRVMLGINAFRADLGGHDVDGVGLRVAYRF